jgi:hypothetical protein
MKCSYWVKKEALSVLNSARKNSSRKKLPTRVYCENNTWYLTSMPLPKVNTIADDLQNIIKFWADDKNTKILSKQEKENTLRILSKLKKISV